MERPQYCVYNQTSECFLSLGVIQHDAALPSFKDILGGRTQRYDEGKWVVHPKGLDFFRLFASRDLVFLDDKHCVVSVLESFPPFQFLSFPTEVASVLTLPVRTIYSSQTQPGNQLVICEAEELEFRLRRMPDLDDFELSGMAISPAEFEGANAESQARDRRSSRRKRWPRLVAYDSAGGALQVHGVKDLSANGLFLLTEERWPLGAQVTMTLQRTDGLDNNSGSNTITVQLRVIRWGKDGVGLAFMQSETEDAPLVMLSAAR